MQYTYFCHRVPCGCQSLFNILTCGNDKWLGDNLQSFATPQTAHIRFYCHAHARVLNRFSHVQALIHSTCPMTSEISPPSIPNRNAIIIGATGLVGQLLLQQLTTMYSHIIVIARRRPDVQPVRDGQIQFCYLDNFQHLAEYMRQLAADIGPQTDAFSCLGTTRKQAGSAAAFRAVDYGCNMAFAQNCHARGVRQFFLLSALGARTGSLFHYSRIKGQLERDIILLRFSRLAIFRPALLLGSHADRPLESCAQRGLAWIYAHLALSPVGQMRPIEAERVAQAMCIRAHTWGVLDPLTDTLPGTDVTIYDNTDLLQMTLPAAS